MSSDLFIFDVSSSSLYQNSSPEEIASSETEFLFGEHEFSLFPDSAIDILQAFSDHHEQTRETSALISPPSQQFQTLNLCNQTGLPNGFEDFHGLDCFSVKTEECQMGFDSNGFYYKNSDIGPHSHSYSGENVAKLIQRSFSSNTIEQKPYSEFSFSPRFETLKESQSFHNHDLGSSENGFLRRVCSTGDLQSFGTVRTTQRSQSSPLESEGSLMEETSIKVGKYSAEARKEKISKYRAKRTLRNFNKTIKYACRKTLADNRPRIRGRFARNDEPGGFDVPKAPSSSSSRPDIDDDDNYDDLCLQGLHEEEEEGTDQIARGQFAYSYGPTQFQYYGF